MRITCNSRSNSYLYIFKHGIGPGTLPEDVNIIKTKDLPNYYTAVWLDRFLTTDEMKQYDIPFETDINYYLDRIGYCQKDGDVVPCDEVNACDKVTASTIPTSDIKLLAEEALNCNTRDELSSVIGSLQSIDKKLYLHYMELLRDNSVSVAYIATHLSDELMGYYVDNVEACNDVMASTKRHPMIPDGWDEIGEGQFDDGRWGCIAKEMPDNSGYYWIDAEEDDRDKLYYTISYAYRTPEGPVGNIIETNKIYYRLGDALKEVDRRIAREFDDVEACDQITASDICYRDRDNDDRVVALDAGMSEADVEEMLAAHPSYYRSTLDRFDDVEACDNIEADSNVTKYTLTPEGQKVFDVVQEIAGVWRVSISTHNNNTIVSDNYSVDVIKEFIDSIKSELRNFNLMYAVSKIDYYRSNLSDDGFRLVVTLKKAYSNETIEGCDDVMASEDDEDKIYWVQAYYSKPHEGLADDFATNDWDAAVDKLVEFANAGYYVMFENVASGEGYEYDPDEVQEALEFGNVYALRRLESLYEG